MTSKRIPSPHYNQRLQQVRALLNEGKYEEAIALAQSALDDYPQWVDAWLLMATAREAIGSIDEAVFALSEATRHARDLLRRALTNYAYFLAVLGDVSEAEKIYKEAITFGGETAGLNYFLARVQTVLGKKAEALTHFRRAVELDRDYQTYISEEFPDIARALNIPVESRSSPPSPEENDEEEPFIFDEIQSDEEE
ncbi:MAG: tetratricopeptide repeat protein [bacterium JZ-2024 1]